MLGELSREHLKNSRKVECSRCKLAFDYPTEPWRHIDLRRQDYRVGPACAAFGAPAALYLNFGCLPFGPRVCLVWSVAAVGECLGAPRQRSHDRAHNDQARLSYSVGTYSSPRTI